jgi:hypothetical protein
MILWELNSDKEFHVNEMNSVFHEFGIPPIATEDSDIRVFRRAWVQFSSIKDKDIIANFINNNKIAIVHRQLEYNDQLDLNHIGSIEMRNISKRVLHSPTSAIRRFAITKIYS